MSRPRRAAEIRRQSRYGYPGRVFGPERVDRLDVGREDQVGGGLLEAPLVEFQRARIRIEILARAELRRVDEDADDDALGMLTSPLDERDVPGMQVAHGRYERNMLAVATPLGDALGEFLSGMNDFHAESKPC